MSLAPGVRLGPYEVTALIGEGGMGKVWRARHTALRRDDALKVLPDAFASDPDRLARFQREAQVLASLNHPNIAHVYGLEQADGVQALVMELVEGPTLADLIARGPIPLDEALPIAKQIAEALEAAHEQGIIHRDLKPANIKIRPDGMVKVLDFGLAKLNDPNASNIPNDQNALSVSPTITSPAMMTGVGILLGTAAYMSPEQAKGLPADRRSDIWAFGCVLYEMLTGQRLFAGDDVSDTLANVLKHSPEWSALPTATPSAIRRLLRRALAKDRRERLPDITVARLEITDALNTPASDAEPAQPVVPARQGLLNRVRLPWIAAVVLGVAILATAAVIALYIQRAPIDSRTVRFSLSPPDGWTLALANPRATGASTMPLTVSPDGRHVAMVVTNGEGRTRLWIRSLDTLVARELPGTDEAVSPFWAPDSRFLGFFAAGKIKKIDVLGGPAVSLCDAADFRGGSWSRDGVIVFATTADAALQKVSASGGVPTPATVLGPGETGHWRPSFLPDGRHFFYRARNGGIYVASLDTPDRSLVIKNPDGNNVSYSQGYLLFLRERTLMAQPFDVRALTLTGEPVPVAERIQTVSAPPTGVFSASDTGVLIYQAGAAEIGSQLMWFNRMGVALGSVGDKAIYGDVEMSRDGKHATVSVLDPAQRTRDIWLVDLTRGVRSRFTFDPANEITAIGSPDGTRIAFNSDRVGGRMNLYEKAANGTASENTLLVDDRTKVPVSWSPDGRFILYIAVSPTTGSDLMVLPLSGDKKPFPFVQTQFNETQGQFSPDGRWVSYVSNDSGINQVYVSPFPGPGGKAQVSVMGGAWPLWRADGKEIFYVDDSNRLVAVPVNGEAGFDVGPVHPLFVLRSPVPGARSFYAAARDGERFLVNTSPDQSTAEPMTVTLNWAATLAK